MAAAFSLLAYLKPGIQFAHWSALGAAGALALAGPLGLYVARNLATVAVGAFALRDGSVPALSAALLLRAVTDGLDAGHNLVGSNLPGAVFAAVMCALDLAALFSVRRAR
jgi:hypothetical protein